MPGNGVFQTVVPPEQFAFHDGFQIEFLRSVIDGAVTFYQCQINPPTPKARHKKLIRLRDCASAMLDTLNDCTDDYLPDLVDVEPPGVRSMLYKLRASADKRAQDLLPQVQPGLAPGGR